MPFGADAGEHASAALVEPLGERTVSSYFDAFAPAPDWEELVWWPPDVFAMANLVLDHTEAYRFVVSPPPGRQWPPFEDWSDRVRSAARQWRAAFSCGRGLPPLVARCWADVTRYRDVPLAAVKHGDAWTLTSALLCLHALADDACAEVESLPSQIIGAFEQHAWRLLETTGSLSRVSPSRVRIVPKTQFTMGGITIRSLSKHLALCYESVDVHWKGIETRPSGQKATYDIVLVPWPKTVHARDFRPVAPTAIANMDGSRFAFFEFAPESTIDPALVDSLLTDALDHAASVDAVVFPEAAVHGDELGDLERTLAAHDVTLLIAGVRRSSGPSSFNRNYLHFGVQTPKGWIRYEQDKHHRWCLDGDQIRQYHLSRSLDPAKLWWEAVDVRERSLHVVDVGGGLTTAPLVCEDLARLDEVADLVRRIGPSLVVAVLLDGPQLAPRWPCRYASVLADDPGSVVLTLTSLGMALRSCGNGTPRSRAVAHWNSRVDGVRQIDLSPRADAVLLSAAVERTTLWTADGRRHPDVPRLRLSEVRQLRAPSR